MCQFVGNDEVHPAIAVQHQLWEHLEHVEHIEHVDYVEHIEQVEHIEHVEHVEPLEEASVATCDTNVFNLVPLELNHIYVFYVLLQYVLVQPVVYCSMF